MAKQRKKKVPSVSSLPHLGGFPPYLEAILPQLINRYDFVKVAGEGKTGVAYHIRSRQTGKDFCLKTVRESVTDPAVRERVRQTLQSEVQILSPLSHRCIPSIYDTQLNAELPFYIATFHPGRTFGAFRNNRLTLSEASYVIWSLMDVLKYLHGEGRTHCDLHQDNVLIHEEVIRFGVMVIDFSSGHRGSDSSPNTENRGYPAFKDAKGLALDRSTVKREEHLHRFQASDFKALGFLLSMMRDCFVGSAAPLQKHAYDEFAKRLNDGTVRTWAEAEDRFRSVLDPLRVISENAYLFQNEHGDPQLISLPPASTVCVGQAPLAVINTDSFQRLRGMRQLSFCDWSFPGATHTRFEHSLGVFGAAQRALKALSHQNAFRQRYTVEECRGFLLGALIHDIGHYPFAHLLEQYAASRFPGNPEAKAAASHEIHAFDLLDTDEQLGAAIKQYWGNDTMLATRSVLTGKAGVLSDAISGPIDVDKIDYLVRDASHCGIPFGAGLDVEGILSSLRCVDNGLHLGVSEDGVPMAEGLMILQDQMLSHVYWHPTVRSLICMFHAILAHVVKDDVAKLKKITQELKAAKSDAHAVSSVLRPWVEQVASQSRKPLDRLLTAFESPRFPEAYIALRTYPSNEEVPRRATSNIYDTIVKDRTHTGDAGGTSQVPIQWRMVQDLRAAFVNAFSERGIKVERIQLAIDVPYGKASRRILAVQRGEGGSEVPITDVSHLNRSIFDRPAAFMSPVRVYAAPEVCSAAGERLSQIVESAEERFFRREGAEVRGEDV